MGTPTIMVAILAPGCGAATTSATSAPRATTAARPAPSPRAEPSDLLAGITVRPSDEQAASVAGNALTVDVLKQLELSHPTANFVDSAYSVAIALAMLDLGARGDTQAQIAAVLHQTGISAEQQAASRKKFDSSLLATAQADGISLDVANAIWLQKGLPFDSSFLNTLVKNFAAPSSVVDFNGDPPGSADRINSWVSDATHGMIPTVVTPGDVQGYKLVLADAIYFDAHWKYQFIAGATTPGPFIRPDDSQVSANLMTTGLLTLSTFSGGGVTAVEMPYIAGHYVADVIMPTVEPIGDFVAGLTPAALAGIEQRMVSTDNVLLTLPKFDIASQESLVAMLQALGMTTAFTEAADFSGIDGGKDIHVGLAMQRAVIHVDEVGTTAAAVTVMGGLGGGGPEPQITRVEINHPFLFIIRDVASGGIIFTAQVTDPTAAS